MRLLMQIPENSHDIRHKIWSVSNDALEQHIMEF